MVPAINSRVGRLTVLRVYRTERTREGRTLIECRCDCGTHVTVTANNIGRGTMSCGCLMRERAREANLRHGRGHTRENFAWAGARSRCISLNNNAFADYGGRGIRMCQEWVDGFEAFFRDMGPCPAGMTLDRVDNDGPYAPDNCRWATRKQQANNRRSNRVLEHSGRTLTLAQWAEETGLPYDAIKQRLNKLGWSPERALTTPARKTKVAA